MSSTEHETYYVPEQSKWPIIGAVGLFFIALGAGTYVNEITKGTSGWGGYMLLGGLAIIIYMVTGWFKDQIQESMSGMYSKQLGVSYRQGMAWFIFSEVMFFAAFFGALFYARILVMPWLGGGTETHAETHNVLWSSFEAVWPLTTTPGGVTTTAMPPWGLPAINTLLLLASSVTLHYAHTSLIDGNRDKLKKMLGVTILFGVVFLGLQVEEYIVAYTEMGLRLDSGIYGNTFFMLTGFHGMHVTLGTIMLIVMFFRVMKGHFTPENHFAFEASSWYWHFVDVVWLFLFIFVYVF